MLMSRPVRNIANKRNVSTLYSPENVLCQENREKTVAKFVNMQPVRWYPNEPAKKAAVLIPICVIDQKVSLLYTLRASNMKNFRGHVSFPGGMQDNSDKSAVETALRETHEELGINAVDIQIWGIGNKIIAKGKTTVTPVIGQITEPMNLKNLNVNRNEVEEVFSVPLENLCNPKYLRHTQFRQFYCMPVFTGGKLRIWGLTGMITYMFLKCLLPSRAYSHNLRQITPPKPAIKTYYYT